MSNCPFFIFFGGFLEIFVNSIELVERNLFLEFVEVKDSNFDDTFSTFIGSICCLIFSFFVNGVELAHFEKHIVLLIDFVLFDAVMELFLSVYLFFKLGKQWCIKWG